LTPSHPATIQTNHSITAASIGPPSNHKATRE
jgi:hypothetical protein